MSDEFYDEYGDPIRDENIRSQMKALKAKAQRADELEAQLARRDTEVAFVKAGVPEDGIGRLFRDAYDGEPTVEAIKAKAAEYGIPGFNNQVPAQTQAADALNDELAAMRRAQGVTASGGEAITNPEQAFLSALQAASSAEEAEKVIEQFQSVTGIYLDRGM
jgi:hypothetical protein